MNALMWFYACIFQCKKFNRLVYYKRHNVNNMQDLSLHTRTIDEVHYSVKKYLSFSLHKCITENKHVLFHVYQPRVMIHFTFSPPLAALARLLWQRWISTPGATSNEIVVTEKRYYCKIIAFLSRRYCHF